MDINSNPGAALILRQGGNQQQVSLKSIKQQAQQDAAVVTMATQTARSAPSAPHLGQNVNIQA